MGNFQYILINQVFKHVVYLYVERAYVCVCVFAYVWTHSCVCVPEYGGPRLNYTIYLIYFLSCMLKTRALLNSELTFLASLATKFALSFAHIPSKSLGLPAWHQAQLAHQCFVETLTTVLIPVWQVPYCCASSIALNLQI